MDHLSKERENARVRCFSARRSVHAALSLSYEVRHGRPHTHTPYDDAQRLYEGRVLNGSGVSDWGKPVLSFGDASTFEVFP